MNKRILTLLMCLVLCFSLVGPAFADISIGTDGSGNVDIVKPGTPTGPTNPTNPGGGGGWYPTTPSDPTYHVTAPASPENGKVSLDKTSAKKGDTVTITVTPDEGYQVGGVTVKDASGKTVPVTPAGDGKYTFTMPDSRVTVDAVFNLIPVVPVNPFGDVFASDYYYDAVLWAVENGITNGTNTEGTRFSPNEPCTRAQIVTFLWRAYGKPAPSSTAHKFADVDTGAYYYDAMLWAVENGITNGTNTEGTRFSPNEPCTRAQAVTFQYRAAKAAPVLGANSFADVAAGDYFANAVQWAVNNGITNGTNAEGTRFSPNNTCTRGQIVTFLYRDMVL